MPSICWPRQTPLPSDTPCCISWVRRLLWGDIVHKPSLEFGKSVEQREVDSNAKSGTAATPWAIFAKHVKDRDAKPLKQMQGPSNTRLCSSVSKLPEHCGDVDVMHPTMPPLCELQGFWLDSSGVRYQIGGDYGDTLVGRTESILWVGRGDSLILRLEGQEFWATCDGGGKLLWNDGVEWTRTICLQELTGFWRSSSGKRQCIDADTFNGGKKRKFQWRIRCFIPRADLPVQQHGTLDGHQNQTLRVEGGKLILQQRCQEYWATANVRGQLVWSDGDVWTREGAEQNKHRLRRGG